MTIKDIRNKPIELQVQDGYISMVRHADGSIQRLDPPVPASKENVDSLMSRANYGMLQVYVNVWNCQATLIVGDRSEDDFNLDPAQAEQLEKLKDQVIYDDNGGAINWSGWYYPSLETLKEIAKLLSLEEPTPR